MDDDQLPQAIEGILSEREAGPSEPILSTAHSCRHITADSFANGTLILLLPKRKPCWGAHSGKSTGKSFRGIKRLLARIFGASGSSAVFAHEEPLKKDEGEDDKEEWKKRTRTKPADLLSLFPACKIKDRQAGFTWVSGKFSQISQGRYLLISTNYEYNQFKGVSMLDDSKAVENGGDWVGQAGQSQ